MKKKFSLASICFILIFCTLPCAFAQKKPNVILITVDTLRSDHLGCYGYKSMVSPTIDTLSKESIHFSNAVSPIPVTTPSHAALFSSLYSRHNKVIRNGGVMKIKQKVLAEILQEKGYKTGGFVSVVLLNKKTKMDRGFDEYGDFSIASAGQKENVDNETGPLDPYDEHHADFDYYFKKHGPREKANKSAGRGVKNKKNRIMQDEKDLAGARQAQRKGEETMALALEWLEKNKKDPFFLWVHLYDPHWPYLPPKKYMKDAGTNPAKWKKLNTITKKLSKSPATNLRKSIFKLTPQDKKTIQALYDGEIRYVDDQIERLFSYLKGKGLYSDSIIIFMADHGEVLGDRFFSDGNRYYGHHLYVYEPSIRIPLLMRLPKIGPKKITKQVRSLDIMPTLLSYLGIEDKEKRDGIDLMPLIKGGQSAGPKFSFIETEIRFSGVRDGNKKASRKRKSKIKRHAEQIGIRTEEWKYFKANNSSGSPDDEFLFNIKKNPQETENLLSKNPGKAKELRELLMPYAETKIIKANRKRPPKRIRPERWEKGSPEWEKVREERKKVKRERRERLEQLKSLGYIQ